MFRRHLDRVVQSVFRLIVLVFLAAPVAHAAECVTDQARFYGHTFFGSWVYGEHGSSLQVAACNAFVGSVDANALGIATGFGAGFVHDHHDGGVTYCIVFIKNPTTTQVVELGFAYELLQDQACPAASEECDGSIEGQTFFSGDASPAASYCDLTSSCRVERKGSTVCLGSLCTTAFVGTGDACGSVTTPNSTTPMDGENCVAGSSAEYCQSEPSDQDCGYVNDNLVCLDSVEDDGCDVFSAGDRVCGPSAPTPPVPDNGTEGTPAEPDEEIVSTVDNITITYNYYDSTTVSNSSRDAGTSGDNPYDGSDDGSGADEGDGDCEGDDCSEEEGSASGGETCDEAPTCSGDAIQCAILDQEWRARCPSIDLETLASDVGLDGEGAPTGTVDAQSLDAGGFLSGGGQCLADVTIDLSDWGTVSVPLSDYCYLFVMFGYVVLTCAYLGAARIVSGAF